MKRHYSILLFACCALAVVFVLPVYGQGDSLGVWSQDLANAARVYSMDISSSNGNLMYCAGLDSGVYKSVNGGTSWVAVNNGLTYNHVQAIALSQSDNNVVYCGTDQNGGANSGVYITTDGGVNWALSINGITDVKAVQSLVVDPTNPSVAFVATFDGVNASTVGVFKTTNRGANWIADSSGLTNKNILSLAMNPLNPNVLYAGSSLILPGSTGPSKIFKTVNGGATWVDISAGLPTNTATGDPVRALSISTLDTARVLAALFLNDTAGGAYLTTNGGLSWIKKHTGLGTVTGTLLRSCLIKPGSTSEFYVGLDGGGATSRGVWRSTDAGNSWAGFNNGSMSNTYTIRALVFKTQGNPTLYAGAANATIAVAGRGVYEYSWTPPPPPPAPNRALLFPTPGVNTNYVQIPHQASMVGFGNSITIEAWVKIGGSTTANTVLNHGAGSFDYQLGINTTTMFPFFRAGGIIVVDSFANLTVGTWAHLAVTYDGGTIKFYKNGVQHLSRVAALTLGSSTNEMRIGRGNNDPASGNLDEVRLWSVARTAGQIDSTKCLKYPGRFASTVGLKALWHFDSTYVDSVSGYNGTPLGNVGFDTLSLPCGPVGVAEIPEVPSNFQLAQNYPNPFNPTTTLQYALPRVSHVTMKVYDLLGQEIVTLQDDVQTAGVHNVLWDGRSKSGTRTASGVYFYRLEAKPADRTEPFVSIKKMLLLK